MNDNFFIPQLVAMLFFGYMIYEFNKKWIKV